MDPTQFLQFQDQVGEITKALQGIDNGLVFISLVLLGIFLVQLYKYLREL